MVFAGKAATSNRTVPRRLHLTALDRGAQYRITLVNGDNAPGLSRGPPAPKEGLIEVSGAWHMHRGVSVPWNYPDTMWVLEGCRQ